MFLTIPSSAVRCLLALCFGVLAAMAPSGEAIARPTSCARAEATRIIADMRRIVVAGGIEETRAVRIGGIDQWVNIRGHNRENPVLLMLHGGPGWVSMPTSWYFQRGWEEYFTVVQWDQRGAGKTYAANDPAALAGTLEVARMVEDAEALVAWLRDELDQDRIFVLGHSWGSYLGLELARRRPEWLHAYVGMGQFVHAMESERRGWAWTMAQARRHGNDAAVRDLQSIAPYAVAGSTPTLAELALQRRWLNFHGGMVHGRDGGAHEAAAATLSPEYSDADLDSLGAASDVSLAHLLPDVLKIDMTDVRRLDVPLVLFLGRHDANVSSTLAAEWFETVQAPAKHLVWFEHSAHEVMNEEPGKTLVALVDVVRPLAASEHRVNRRRPQIEEE